MSALPNLALNSEQAKAVHVLKIFILLRETGKHIFFTVVSGLMKVSPRNTEWHSTQPVSSGKFS